MVSALLRWWRRRHLAKLEAANSYTYRQWRAWAEAQKAAPRAEVKRRVVQIAERAERIRRRA